ncbi:MAG: anhydro-N-acetylmuramic acid kinase [Lautropia sp.]
MTTAPADGLAGCYIGLMSGTSIDGVDGVLAEFDAAGQLLGTRAVASLPMPEPLRRTLTALQAPGPDELATAALAGNALADIYADCVQVLLARAGCRPTEIVAQAAHGQTVRHDPARGYTIQLLNGARLAERTGITTVTDLRSADVAAGGQGAPLVPVFHARVFADAGRRRGIVNIGGIGNLTVLPGRADTPVLGFDTGPGNTLLDGWCERHQGTRYDADGRWAASGRVDPALLARLLQEPYFALPAPKSTGRDLFNLDWLARRLDADAAPADVQATLLALTVSTIADAVRAHRIEEVFVCGGGAANLELMTRLRERLQSPAIPVDATTVLGLDPQAVEATAFAWLARQRLAEAPGNAPSITGAARLRVLGAVHSPR